MIPFPVSIVLGTERKNYELLKRDLEDLDRVAIGELPELRAGIDRRKKALAKVLKQDTYEALNVASMGQKHSERLARFIWDMAMLRSNQSTK